MHCVDMIILDLERQQGQDTASKVGKVLDIRQQYGKEHDLAVRHIRKQRGLHSDPTATIHQASVSPRTSVCG
jgi:hypothetical protein